MSEDKFDFIPADYRPSCFECEHFADCNGPNMAVDIFRTTLAVLILERGIDTKELLDRNALALEAIDIMESAVKDIQKRLSGNDDQSKMINMLRLMDFITVQEATGDNMIRDRLVEIYGDDL